MSQKIISLFIAGLSLWMIMPLSVANTLHTIIVADTSDWQAGPSFSRDLSRIRNLADTISQNTHLTLEFYEISGDNLNRNKVISTLEGMSIGSEDVVFFHYAGHGGRAPNKSTLWPSMNIRDGALDIDWVKSTLEQKNPRFLIILADTCNNFDDSLSSPGGSSTTRSLSSSEGYRQLFLNYRGHVFASGSKPGQYSWGNSERGGFFTNAFLNSLNRELSSSNPNWYTIMKRAEAPIEFKGMIQNPQSQVSINHVHGGPGPDRDQCSYFYKSDNVLCCKTPDGTTICDNGESPPEGACPPGGLFMKPGGIECCRRPTGVTCQ